MACLTRIAGKVASDGFTWNSEKINYFIISEVSKPSQAEWLLFPTYLVTNLCEPLSFSVSNPVMKILL